MEERSAAPAGASSTRFREQLFVLKLCDIPTGHCDIISCFKRLGLTNRMSLTSAYRRSAIQASQFLTYDFLALSFIHLSRPSRGIRCLSTAQKAPASITPSLQTPIHSSPSPTGSTSNPKEPLSLAQLQFLTSAASRPPLP